MKLKFAISLVTFVSIIISTSLYAKNLYPKSYAKTMWSGELSVFEKEREYNRNGSDIDEVKLYGLSTRYDYKKRYNSRIYYNIGFDYLIDGYFEEEYREELDYISDKETDTSGLREPDFLIEYWLKRPKDQSVSHAFKFYIRPKIFSSKISRYGNGGTDTEFGYIFNYELENFLLDGDIYSRIYGKREVVLLGQLKETTSSYTEVGLNVNIGYRLAFFVPKASFTYASTTEYKSYNRYFKRESDKGFGTNIGVHLGFLLGDNQKLDLSFYSKSFKFNSTDEDLSRDITYELERKQIALKYTLGVN